MRAKSRESVQREAVPFFVFLVFFCGWSCFRRSTAKHGALRCLCCLLRGEQKATKGTKNSRQGTRPARGRTGRVSLSELQAAVSNVAFARAMPPGSGSDHGNWFWPRNLTRSRGAWRGLRALLGRSFPPQGARLGVSDTFEIVSSQPLRAAYLAAEGAERGRVTDRLILNYLPGNRTWVSGAVISDYQAVIRCRE